MRPTIIGIRNGTDEVLERAKNCRLSVEDIYKHYDATVIWDKTNINIQTKEHFNFNVSLFDINGRTLYNSSNNYYDTNIPISHLPNGMYLVNVKSTNGDIVGLYKVLKN